ncbi:MAG: LLM class flavin-dependent oxidoreductase [Anaerolineaceae bacterium]|nr:LLM class flavin-dependent oxidoreductase [Anaerolineaceae bacterium]
MLKPGLNIIPSLPVADILATVKAAEDIGYDYFLLADEGFMQDVYVVLGAAARETTRIRLGPVTNGYTRHPAVTAAALASLDEISAGRAFVTLIPGGSFVLKPMNIPRQAPVQVIRESITVMRRLWSGETVTWQGERFQLDQARLTAPPREQIPIWIAPRAERMLELAGELGDAALLMVKADLGAALQVVERGSARSGRRPLRAYFDRLAYTPQLIQQTAEFFPNVIVDTPERQLKSFLSEAQIRQVRQAVAEGGVQAAAAYVTPPRWSRATKSPAARRNAARRSASSPPSTGWTCSSSTSPPIHWQPTCARSKRYTPSSPGPTRFLPSPAPQPAVSQARPTPTTRLTYTR